MAALETQVPPPTAIQPPYKMNISLPAPKREMGVRGITGAIMYFYDGKTQKQITQAEYDRQTLAGIAAALGAEAVVFKPESSAARRRDLAAAAEQQLAGVKDGAKAAAEQSPRPKKEGVPQHGLADYMEAAMEGGKKAQPAKKGSASGSPPPSGGGKGKKVNEFSLEEALGK